MYAVVRIRGTGGINAVKRMTLQMLRLTKPNHCVIVDETDSFKGSLRKVSEFLTWGEIDDKTLASLLEKRGGVEKKNIPKEVKNLMSGKKSEAKQPFRLAPPLKGWEHGGVKRPFNMGGATGYRKEKINSLLKKMI